MLNSVMVNSSLGETRANVEQDEVQLLWVFQQLKQVSSHIKDQSVFLAVVSLSKAAEPQYVSPTLLFLRLGIDFQAYFL